MAIKYLNPKVDLVFKRIFGTRKHITIDFLNAMLPLEAPIAELEFVATELAPDQPWGKLSIVDVRCRDAEGRHFLVEMQNRWDRWFFNRIAHSSARVYYTQLRQGQSYEHLKPVYMLALLDTVFAPDNPAWRHHYSTRNEAPPYDKMKFVETVLVELPKHPADNLNSVRDLWTRFLSDTDEWLRIPDDRLTAHPPIREALEMSEEAAFDETERERYQRELDVLRMEISFEQSRKERDRQMAEQKRELRDNKRALEAQKQTIEEHKRALEDKDRALQDKDRALQDKDRALQDAVNARKQTALRLHEQQLPLEVIAKALDADLAEVKAWLGLEA